MPDVSLSLSLKEAQIPTESLRGKFRFLDADSGFFRQLLLPRIKSGESIVRSLEANRALFRVHLAERKTRFAP